MIRWVTCSVWVNVCDWNTVYCILYVSVWLVVVVAVVVVSSFCFIIRFFLFPFYYRTFKRHFEQTQFNLARCMEQQQQQQQHTFRPLTMRTWLEPRTGRNAMCVHIISSIFRLLFSSMRIRKLIFGWWKRERKIALNQTDQIKLTDGLLTANKIHGKTAYHIKWKNKNEFYFFRFRANNKLNTHIYKNGQIVKKNNKKRARKLNWKSAAIKRNDIKKNMWWYNR